MKIYKYITILMIVLLGISADEIWVRPWLPIPFSIPLPASVSLSPYGDQTMRPHFEMIDDLSF